MRSAASAVSPKDISPEEAVNAELRKAGATGADGSLHVLSPHTHHRAIAPAPTEAILALTAATHTPKEKRLHSLPASAFSQRMSANASSAEHMIILPLSALGEFMPTPGEPFRLK